MKVKSILAALFLFATIAGLFLFDFISTRRISGAPPGGSPESEVPQLGNQNPWVNWRRPEGPPKVALQVGHWKNDQVPEELKNLRGNTGAQGGGKSEYEVNLAIALATQQVLVKEGIEVDILPTVVPPDYWADAFIAIHADGSPNSQTSGYKVAGPWRDLTGSGDKLVSALDTAYQPLGLAKDPNITRNMRGYYAFAWWRYEHSIHPMTAAAIVETGFLTNPNDRALIVDNYQNSANAIADGVLSYLESEKLL